MDNVKHLVALWVSPLPLFKGISISSIIQNWDEVARSHPIARRIFPRWHPPPHGALKLNFDGSATGNPGMEGVGVIRNEDGIIIVLLRPRNAK